ncbi:MAG: hypothetical protein JWO68_2882 [Actinomycetia bacterium]|nr:hypothetical protein [Actinomycetes bacterium]
MRADARSTARAMVEGLGATAVPPDVSAQALGDELARMVFVLLAILAPLLGVPHEDLRAEMWRRLDEQDGVRTLRVVD